MGITKYYSFDCDNCGNADYPPGRNIKDSISVFRREKGVVSADGKVFCNKKCYDEYKAHV